MDETNETADSQGAPQQSTPVPSPISLKKTVSEQPETTKTPPQSTEQKLERRFSIFEGWMVAITVIGVAVAAITGVIFWKQLGVMNGQLNEMKRSGDSATDQLWQAIGNMNWMARTADGGLHQTREAMDAAGKQSKASLEASIAQSQAALKASIDQLSAMQKHTEVSERPWLSLDASIASPLTFGADGARITFQFTLKNSGKSPAVGVFLEPELYTLSLKKNPVAERKRLCTELLKRGPAIGETVFPGEVKPVLHGLNLIPKDIAEGSAPDGRGLIVNVIACVAYRPPFGEYVQAPYYTGILYDLGRSDPAHPNLMFVIKPSEDVPTQRLFFVPSAVFGTITQ